MEESYKYCDLPDSADKLIIDESTSMEQAILARTAMALNEYEEYLDKNPGYICVKSSHELSDIEAEELEDSLSKKQWIETQIRQLALGACRQSYESKVFAVMSESLQANRSGERDYINRDNVINRVASYIQKDLISKNALKLDDFGSFQEDQAMLHLRLLANPDSLSEDQKEKSIEYRRNILFEDIVTYLILTEKWFGEKTYAVKASTKDDEAKKIDIIVNTELTDGKTERLAIDVTTGTDVINTKFRNVIKKIKSPSEIVFEEQPNHKGHKAGSDTFIPFLVCMGPDNVNELIAEFDSDIQSDADRQDNRESRAPYIALFINQIVSQLNLYELILDKIRHDQKSHEDQIVIENRLDSVRRVKRDYLVKLERIQRASKIILEDSSTIIFDNLIKKESQTYTKVNTKGKRRRK